MGGRGARCARTTTLDDCIPLAPEITAIGGLNMTALDEECLEFDSEIVNIEWDEVYPIQAPKPTEKPAIP